MNFWNTIQDNKETINKSFYYIYKNCPDKEGYINAFNNLIIKLYDLNVFNKFNKNKSTYNNKKFQQFLFMWIYKILHDNYKLNKNLQNKFKTNINIDSYINIKELQIEHTDTKISTSKDRRGKIYPPCYQNVSYTNFLPDKHIEYIQNRNLILKHLKKDILKKIFLFIEKGYSKKEITDSLNISYQYLSICINKIKKCIISLKEKKLLIL